MESHAPDLIERARLLARIAELELELAHYSARYGLTDEARRLLRRPDLK